MSEAHVSARRIDELVAQLKNLHAGELALPDVVALGEPAIPALEALLRGPPDAVYRPRYWAADALAAIPGSASTAALVRALRDSVARRLDPVSLEAEDVIVNRIADHLAERPDSNVAEALLEAFGVRLYSHCASALGRLREPRALPRLIECLFDDVARPAAVAALCEFGERAVAPVARVLLVPRLVDGREPPYALDARAAAARLLGAISNRAVASNDRGVAPEAIDRTLTLALRDAQRAVRIEAALALARSPGPWLDKVEHVLLGALDEPHWARAQTVMDALASLGTRCEPALTSLVLREAQDEPGRLRQLRAIELLPRIAPRSASARLARFSRAPDQRLRLAAVAGLDQITGVDRDILARFLDDEAAVVRRRAVAALCRRGALEVDSAVALLGDRDPVVRKLAADCLRASGRRAQSQIQKAVRSFGAPLHGIGARWRLWWRACLLCVVGSLLMQRWLRR